MGMSNQIPSSRLVQPGVCTSTTRPASPFEGQAIFETDTDRMLIWNGTTWVMPNKPTINPDGLELITAVTCSSGGTASNGVVTVGSAVSSVVINNAFSSTYENYQVVISSIDLSIADYSIVLKLNNSSGSTYNSGSLSIPYFQSGSFSWQPSTNLGFYIGYGGDQNNSSVVCTLYGPFLTQQTAASWTSAGQNYGWTGNGMDKNAVSSTGFTISAPSTTLTGGTIAVYGYRK